MGQENHVKEPSQLYSEWKSIFERLYQIKCL